MRDIISTLPISIWGSGLLRSSDVNFPSLANTNHEQWPW